MKAIARMAVTCVILKIVLFCAGWNSHAAIINAKAPKGSERMVRQEINHAFLGISPTQQVTLSPPYRAYYVGLTNLASGELLGAARPGGWKYLLLIETNAVGTVVLGADEKTGRLLGLEYNSIGRSPFEKPTLEALRLAEQFPKVQEQDYEPRLLDIVGVSFMGMWFHGKTNDFIIPFPPTFDRYQAYRAYSEQELIQLLQSKAQRNVEMWQDLDRRKKSRSELQVPPTAPAKPAL